MSMDETFEIISIFSELGIHKIRLTGGEPLLRKGLPELIFKIKNLDNIREVVMTSNGILLGDFAKTLKVAGLDRVNVSLDTLDRENFKAITGYDKLNEVLAGINAAIEAGIGPIKINTVLMKGYNDHEVMELLGFAIENKMEIRFIEWMPTSAEIHDTRQGRFVSAESVKNEIQKYYTLIPDDSNPHAPAKTFKIEGTHSKVGFISPLSNAFCAMCNRLRLKANGMMKTCLHGSEDLDIKGLFRQGLSRETIKEKIQSVVYDRPEEHFLNNASVPHKDFVMTAVGG